MKRNSDFKFDLMLGELAEDSVSELLYEKKLEVKRDFRATVTGNIFIEYQSRGKPSGIASTHADFYCIIISDEQFFFLATQRLKNLCRKYIGSERDVLGGDNNTSKGILLPITDLIL